MQDGTQEPGDREQRIREIAYSLWEQEGYPEDQAERHWLAAVAIVDAERAEDAQPVESADENPGEAGEVEKASAAAHEPSPAKPAAARIRPGRSPARRKRSSIVAASSLNGRPPAGSTPLPVCKVRLGFGAGRRDLRRQDGTEINDRQPREFDRPLAGGYRQRRMPRTGSPD